MKTRDYCIGFLWLLLFILPGHIKSQSIEGCVTHGITGEPLEGAQLECAGYMCLTGADGYYSFSNLPLGNWNLTCVYGDLCPFDTLLNLTGQGIELDILLYPCLDLIVDPLNIEVTLEPNAQTTEIITISNPNETSVGWSAELEVFPPGEDKEFLDVQFQYPVTGTYSHVGIECDGTYFYITDPYNDIISKYALDGTFIDTFTMITGLYDLAFDGTYFYGSAASTTILVMDFSSQNVVSSITAPGDVRALAYNYDEDIFYGYSWGGDILVFDQSGANLGGAPVGPGGANYSGFAYDNVTDEGPYLWGYGSAGTDLNVLVQIQLPTLQETGLIVNLDELLPEPLNNGAGGLFSHPDIFPGTWTLGGVVMNEWIWGLELANDGQTWVTIEPTSGVLEPGESEVMNVNIYATTDQIPWTYEAEIEFTTIPDVGSPTVDVILHYEGEGPFPYPVEAAINCVNVDLTWDLSNLYYPPVTFNIYKDGNLIANVLDMYYTDSLVIPEETYIYGVSAVYSIFETWPNPVNVTVPLPDELEPTTINANIINNNILCLNWGTNACLLPEYYSLYKNGELLAQLNDPEYCDTLFTSGYYEYYVTATYYFGEFGPSNSFYFLYTETSETIQNNKIELYPNPTNDKLSVRSFSAIHQVELYDLQGSMIMSNKFNEKEIQLDVANLNPGVYFLKLKYGHGVVREKIVIK